MTGQLRFSVGVAAGAVGTIGIFVAGLRYGAAAPQQWPAGTTTPLTATDLNKLSVIDAGPNGLYAVGATAYCGHTTGTYQGNLGGSGGYALAKQLCASGVTGCSATAHMCSAEELTRSQQLGIALTNPSLAWYSTGAMSTAPTGTQPIRDCIGWTSVSNTERGPDTDSSGHPNSDTCDNPRQILCCDGVGAP
jgi:hypothetical protein